MNIDNKLDELKKIKQVDAPPFLLTRIRQQIQSLEKAPAPVKWKWTFAATAIIILALNVSIVFKSGDSETNSGVNDIVSAMHLSNSNALYNE